MLGVGQHHQILWTIVELVAVYVMYLLVGRERAAQHSLGYGPVFVDVLPAHADNAIAHLIDVAAFPARVCFAAASRVNAAWIAEALFAAMWLYKERLAAVFADARDAQLAAIVPANIFARLADVVIPLLVGAGRDRRWFTATAKAIAVRYVGVSFAPPSPIARYTHSRILR